jgi:hypothetical protein
VGKQQKKTVNNENYESIWLTYCREEAKEFSLFTIL